MVTVEAVWAALAEIPDPEIPVISLVDLGVIRDVEVDGSRVRVEFTPTFLGCPALEVMRRAIVCAHSSRCSSTSGAQRYSSGGRSNASASASVPSSCAASS